jgi:hypothetical protein
MNKYFQDVHKSGKPTADDLSHGQKGGKPDGILNTLLDSYRRNCTGKPAKGGCGDLLAFYYGVLSHVAADAVWHRVFIPSVADACNLSYEDAHIFSDADVDICLAKRMNGFPEEPYWRTEYEKARFTKDDTICPSGEWHDTRDIGNKDLLKLPCYRCPSGFEHDNLQAAKSDKVCFRRETVNCKLLHVDSIKLPRGGPLPSPVNQYAIKSSVFDADLHTRIIAAYSPLVSTVYVEEIVKTVATFYVGANLEVDAGDSGSHAFSGSAPKCDAGFRRAVRDEAGILDSAAKVAAFWNAFGEAMAKNPSTVAILRTDRHGTSKMDLCVSAGGIKTYCLYEKP